MSLSDVEIAQVVDELAPRLRGAAVGKVYDAGPHTLVLELGRDRLLLSAHPRASRLHLAEATPKPAAGAAPSAYAMLLRKRLGGLRLEALRVLVPGERVVTLEFGAPRARLIAELMGPHANVFLVEPEGRIVASLRPTGSSTRLLAPGATWSPPPPGPPTAAWRGRQRFGVPPGVAERVATHYGVVLRTAETEELRTRAATGLRRTVDRLERREVALRGDLARIAEASVFRKYGDLLLAHLHEVPGRGATNVTVPDDFEDGAPLTIVLEAALDARENAARYYRQHRRLTGGKKRVEERLALTRAARDAALAKLAALPQLSLEQLRQLVGGAPTPRQRRQRAEEAPRLPYREFRSVAGDIILVGRSAADNDTLSFRVARGGDLWLHTRDAPGSHVIVRAGNREVPEQTLLDAATLAAHYSPLAREEQVDITYTRVKHLRKPKGAAPGLVYVAEAKTLRVRIEASRLERLLARDRDDAG